VAVPLTFLLACLGWVLFRADTASRALDYFQALVNATPAASGLGKMSAPFVDPRFITAFVIAMIGAFAPLLGLGRLIPTDWGSEAPAPTTGSLVARFVLSSALVLASAIVLAMGGFNPFIYFRF
jgi:alginate O-acetyltransferase complex protein AlgI